jgi:predicted DNA-binding protein (UPF0251 family)
MATTITVYTFEDMHGDDSGTFETQNYDEAKRHAAQYRLRIMANEYEWSEAYPLEDYTGADETHDVDEVAASLRVAPRTVTRWIQSGRLKVAEGTKRADWRVSGKALVAFLEEHGIPVPAELA